MGVVLMANRILKNIVPLTKVSAQTRYNLNTGSDKYTPGLYRLSDVDGDLINYSRYSK